MGLEKIFDQIKKETDLKIKNILDEAQSKADQILKEADVSAQNITKKAKVDADAEIENKSAMEKARLKIESEAVVKRAIDSAFNQSISLLRSSIKEIKSTDLYDKLLKNIVDSALKSLGEDAKIYVLKEDIPRLQKKPKQLKVSPKKMEGGIYAESADGKKSLDLSLENLLRELNDEISEEVLSKIKV